MESRNEGIEVASIDEAIEFLTFKIKEIDELLPLIQIEDPRYSKKFWEEVKNALITISVIKAFGIGHKAELYLEPIKKLVTELTIADNNG
ncbi:hypothetical protein [Veillonella caviae]|uniref:hypothetical protein n=1 Tax=Veillonella caviae TaxID=248316 RepID=UPI002357AE81|nr:hypothetical protein [Veillonella caviae]